MDRTLSSSSSSPRPIPIERLVHNPMNSAKQFGGKPMSSIIRFTVVDTEPATAGTYIVTAETGLTAGNEVQSSIHASPVDSDLKMDRDRTIRFLKKIGNFVACQLIQQLKDDAVVTMRIDL